jgi:hypothetical protein
LEFILVAIEIEQVNSIILSLPIATTMGTILKEKSVANPEDIEGPMSTHPRQVAEEECGLPKVDAKTPLELIIDRNMLGAKIIVSGLTMS